MVATIFAEDQYYLLGDWPQDEDIESYAIFLDSESGNNYSLLAANQFRYGNFVLDVSNEGIRADKFHLIYRIKNLPSDAEYINDKTGLTFAKKSLSELMAFIRMMLNSFTESCTIDVDLSYESELSPCAALDQTTTWKEVLGI